MRLGLVQYTVVTATIVMSLEAVGNVLVLSLLVTPAAAARMHLAAPLSLLAGNDIKVVREKLGHSSRQITSDTYTSVLPEMMRAEAESDMAVVPRDIALAVHTPLEIPETAWQGGLAVLFAHGARQSGDAWAFGAQPRPDSDLVGLVTLAGRGQEDAANAAVKWIRDHCAARTDGRCRQACRRQREPAPAGRRIGVGGRLASPVSPDPAPCPLYVPWILV